MRWALTLLMLMSLGVRAEYAIPASNRIDWASFIGVEGGIPYYSTLADDLTGDVDATGVVNARTIIQNAITAAAWGSYVQLPAGEILLTGGNLSTKDGVVLRGTGTNTLLVLNGCRIELSGGGGWISKTVLATTSTNTSTNIFVTASVGSDITAGSIIWIDQLNDTSFVFAEGWETDTPATCGYCDDPVNNGTRVMSQPMQVRSIANGTNITFYPPLVWDWTLTPMIRYRANLSGTNNMRVWAGLENLKFTSPSTPNNHHVYMLGAANCWVSNCWSLIFGEEYASIFQQNTFRCTVTRNWWEGGGSNQRALGFYEFIRNGFNATYDNIGFKLDGMMYRAGCGVGNVWAYNAMCRYTNSTTALRGDWYHHGGHPLFMVNEGNYGLRLYYDSIHGTGSHTITWRNWMRGREDWNTFGMGPFWNDSTNWFGYYIGNVAWYSGVNRGNYGYIFEQHSPTAYQNTNTTHRWGYSNFNDVPDTVNKAKNTVHGLYDFMGGTNAILYAAGLDQDIPASAIWTEKPAWFGHAPWPPFEVELIPGDSTTLQLTNLPAGHRFVYGTDFPEPAEGGGSAATVTGRSVPGGKVRGIPRGKVRSL